MYIVTFSFTMPKNDQNQTSDVLFYVLGVSSRAAQ